MLNMNKCNSTREINRNSLIYCYYILTNSFNYLFNQSYVFTLYLKTNFNERV